MAAASKPGAERKIAVYHEFASDGASKNAVVRCARQTCAAARCLYGVEYDSGAIAFQWSLLPGFISKRKGHWCKKKNNIAISL